MPGCTKDLCCAYCGGIVDWDEEHRYGVCRYCGHTSINIPANDSALERDRELDEAVKAWSQGNPLSAVKNIKNVLSSDPTDPRAILFLSYITRKDKPPLDIELDSADRRFLQNLASVDRRFGVFITPYLKS